MSTREMSPPLSVHTARRWRSALTVCFSLLLSTVAMTGAIGQGLAAQGGEVTATASHVKREGGRVWIEGVPTLGWGKGRECTFLGALEAATAVTDHPYQYSDLMGWSGMAFRVRWFAPEGSPRWCPSSPVGEIEEEIGAVAKATGWPLRFEFVEKSDPAKLRSVTADIVASVGAGRPVLAYEPKLNMDVVFGYEDDGKTLLLRDYFKPETPLRLGPSELGFLTISLGDFGAAMSRREAMVEGLRTAVRNWHRERFSEGPGEYWYGDAALARWLSDLRRFDDYSQEERNSLCSVGWWNYVSLVDARHAAVAFLRENVSLLPEGAAGPLARAAGLYEQEAELLGAALAKRDVFTGSPEGWSKDRQERECKLLAQARSLESSAITLVEAALSTADAGATLR